MDSYYGPNITIYTDGQLLYLDSAGKYLEKQLSKTEVDRFILNLKLLGFFEIKSNGQNDPADPIYHFGPGDDNCLGADGIRTEVMVYGENSHEIIFHEECNQFVIQPVKNILYFLDHYKPNGLTRYQPDRILLFITIGREPYTDPAMPAVPWPAEIAIPDPTPNSFNIEDGKLMYMEGKEANTLYQLEAINKSYIFSWEGHEYAVDILPILPDQCGKRVYDPGGSPLGFVCND
jgi:hypothetical protein